VGVGIANSTYLANALYHAESTATATILPIIIQPTSLPVYLTATTTLVPTLTSPPTLTPIPTDTPTQLPQVVPLIVNDPTPISFGPFNFPSVVNPLTGLPTENFSLLDRRPIAVKITNYPRSVRPQAGLSRADIVWEYHIESGVSRFVAIFYGQEAQKAGPVRSGRFFDEHIFRMYDAIFVFGNADHRVMNYFLGLGKYYVNSFVLEPDRGASPDCGPSTYEYLCRDRDIISYNSLFTNTAALTEYITERNGNHRPDLAGMSFSYQTPPNGQVALNIYTRYSLFTYNWWQYSLEQGRYLRYQETIGYADPMRESYARHMDDLSGEQLAADNVVILNVPHEYYVKTNTTEIYKIHLVSAGTGYVFRDGFVFPIFWSRPDDGGVINLFTLDGEYFPLKPGETWYQVFSEESTLSIVNGIDWRFVFVPPVIPDEPIDPSLRANTNP
ncbi:MAG: DUF3048 domain-containing protein, partial [Chloroflexi bacterium]|nr:DUF3048 domain-containing protein [Chloroflexota bacterium]